MKKDILQITIVIALICIIFYNNQNIEPYWYSYPRKPCMWGADGNTRCGPWYNQNPYFYTYPFLQSYYI